MNWDAITFDWNQVRAFLATVEEGSLSAAARRLGAAQPTIGRQIAALEAELGVALFERSGRSPVLTTSGARLVDHARAMAEAATGLSLAAAGQSTAIEGLVRVTASDMMTVEVMPDVVALLAERAPGVRIDLLAANDLTDLLSREADIAVRHVRPVQSDLVAKLIREETAQFYAATSYLERYGRPETLEDLSTHEFIGFGDQDLLISELNKLNLNLTADNFRHGSESVYVAWALVRRGLGVAIMSDRLGRAAPEVEPILPGMKPLTFPVWLVAHRELRSSRRIRVVWDVLEEVLSAPIPD